MFSIVMFNDSYANIVTITFSSLILIELLNVYTQVRLYYPCNYLNLDQQRIILDASNSDSHGRSLLHDNSITLGVLRHKLHRLPLLCQDWHNHTDHVGTPSYDLLLLGVVRPQRT